jgi:hypothetical protein
LYSDASPALCVDEGRQYLWALLDKQSAVPKSDDAVQLTSHAVTVTRPVARRRKKAAQPVSAERNSRIIVPASMPVPTRTM